MIKVYTSTDIYGVWGSFILNNLTEGDYEFNFNKGLDFNKLKEDIDEDADSYCVVLLGKPIKENQVALVENALSEVRNLPFTMTYHLANWGDKIDVDVSTVDTKVNYTSKLIEEISKGTGFIKFKNKASEEFAKRIGEGLQSHHKYDGGLLGKNLMLLAELYQKDLINKSYIKIEDIGTLEEDVLTSLRRNMSNYVSRKVEEADIQVLDSGVIVVSLFAEQHINELGKVIIDSLSRNGSKVVVLIGKQTRGDDLFRIRTSEGVSASGVAHTLNRGKGKERAATVFLPKGNQPVYNTIVRTLNSADV